MKGKCIALAAALALSACQVSAAAAPAAYTDVQPDQWFYEDVMAASALDLMNGVGGGQFAPTRAVTLEEAITMAVRLHAWYHGLTIRDPAPGELWQDPYLEYAETHGILDGLYLEGTLSRPAQRAQCVALFANAVPASALTPINSIPDGAIPDLNPEDPLGAEVYALYRAGILTGVNSSGTFQGDWFITRCETAAILVRFQDPQARESFSLSLPPPVS